VNVELSHDGLLAHVSGLSLRLLAAVDTVDGVDETLAVEVSQGDGVVEVRRRSTLWDDAVVQLVEAGDALEVRTTVRGRGRLARTQLLAGRSLLPGRPLGLFPSGTTRRTLFTPNPDDPDRVERSAFAAAAIGVVGDSEPGRGRWFFTPAPLYFGLRGDDGWLGISLAAPVEELTFPELEWVGGDRAFHLAFDYEGHTEVDGEHRLPTVLIAPHEGDAYEGLRVHRRLLVARGLSPEPAERERPAWWSEPMFCGWGAQSADAVGTTARTADLATQERYDAYLAHLASEGLVPGTVAVDDKWAASYGRNEPDTAKWPDLRGWIAERHAQGQRVLLWWKAWDAEGLPPELCVRTPDGVPVALDPSNPAARDELAAIIRSMLSPDGLDADGFKIDFTARTPSGYALASHGGSWGIALLHELLAVVYRAAKEAKPDALVVTHTPHPSFVDVTDMIRLNDMVRLDDSEIPASVVPQMEHRARVAHATCPEVLVDTDDWCVPSLAAWREYLVAKPLLGVPALYYASKLDGSGEHFEPGDYGALRELWAAWRERKT
jgi:hypothetical protein